MWAFLRNFAADKFWQAAKAGVLDGQPPYTFGAVFALETESLGGQAVFGDFDLGVTGFGITFGSINRIFCADGTLQLVSGSGQNVDGTPVPDSDPTAGTFEVDDANLCNRLKGYMDPGSAPGGAGGTTAARSWPSPRVGQLVYVVLSNNGATSFVYCNGKVVGLSAEGSALNVDPVRIGLDNAGASPAAGVLFAGAFYHSALLPLATIDSHFQSCQQAKDLVATSLYSGGVLDYVWSVKQSQIWDGRTTWASVGAQASINMVRQGAGLSFFSGENADVLAADLNWMTV